MSRAVSQMIQAVIDGVDHVALEMERKWGVGRLRLLVDVDLRVAFDRQLEKFNAAIWSHDLEDVRIHSGAMTAAGRHSTRPQLQ